MNDDWEVISEVGSVVSLGSDWGQSPARSFKDAVMASLAGTSSTTTTIKSTAALSKTTATKAAATAAASPKCGLNATGGLNLIPDNNSKDTYAKNVHAFQPVKRRGKKTRSNNSSYPNSHDTKR